MKNTWKWSKTTRNGRTIYESRPKQFRIIFGFGTRGAPWLLARLDDMPVESCRTLAEAKEIAESYEHERERP